MRVSDYYNLDLTQAHLDFVDVRLDTDIPVFVDPTALRNLSSPFAAECISLLQSFFECILDHIKSGNLKEANELLSSLNERNEFHLGLSNGESHGHAIGAKYAKLMLAAIQKTPAASTGLLQDLEDTCLLIQGIGPDLISDAICNIIRRPLINYTQEMCNYYGIPLTPKIASGAQWDPTQNKWYDELIDLPVTSKGPLLLVPRSIVRLRFSFDAQKYYRHYLLPEMQKYELAANTSLVRILKDGSKKVPTKKSLISRYGNDKLAILKQTQRFPSVLGNYKKHIREQINKSLNNEELSSIKGSIVNVDWDNLISDLKAIKSGNEDASTYHKHIEKILVALFFPHLVHPIKEYELHEGRKRVDIRLTNEASSGFFYWLALHYPSQYIWIECKNYTRNVANPEVDQLSGRFSPTRGKVGLLTYRKIDDKNVLLNRCKDTATDDRGFIIPLDDDDLIEMMTDLKSNEDNDSYQLLKKRFDFLVS